MNAQSQKINQLERQGWTFSNWIPAAPDADGNPVDDAMCAVMIKRTKLGTDYAEVEPDGTVQGDA